MSLSGGRQAGAALLEAIVAITILGIVAVSSLATARSGSSAVAVARDADRSMRDADALLQAAALWTRAQLDQRLGERRQGPWLMRIERLRPELYAVALADSATRVVRLGTTLYRSLPADAER